MSVSKEQAVENALREGINFLKLRPDLFQEINRMVALRIMSTSRVMNDGQLFLLHSSFWSFGIPFREYYDRVFRKEIKEGQLEKRIMEKGFDKGEAIFIKTVINELDIRKCIEVEGGIDEKTINETLSKRLKILGNEERVRAAFWEIIRAVEEALSKVSKQGSEELMEIYGKLLEVVKTGGINAVKSELEKLTIEFDSRLRKEFVVG